MRMGNGRDVILWGAAGHAKVLAECLSYGNDRVIAMFDNNPNATSPLPGVPLFIGFAGLDQWLRENPARQAYFLIAIGGDKGRDRVELHNRLTDARLVPLSVVHPTAFIAKDAALGEGSQVLAGAAVCVGCVIGMQTIINTRASIDHECELGMGVHVAPGATVTGCVRVGDFSMLGAGSVVLPRVSIGANVTVGAGAVVTKDVPDNVIVYGTPARIMERKDTCA